MLPIHRLSALSAVAIAAVAAVMSGLVVAVPAAARPRPPHRSGCGSRPRTAPSACPPGTRPRSRPAARTQLTITVDPSRRYQTMDGFGASITDSSAVVLYRLDPAARDADDARPVRPEPRRRAVASCASRWAPRTSSTAPHYTYDDVPAGRDRLRAGGTSPSPTTRPQILPLLRQALALNPELKVMATPWSPPAWMKTNDSLIGGRLIDDPRDLPGLRALLREVRAGLPQAGRAGRRAHACRTSRRTGTPAATPAPTCPSRQEAKLDRRARPGAATPPGLRHEDPRLRPQLVRAPQRHRRRRRRARTPRPTTRTDLLQLRRGAAGSPAPPTTATPATRARMTELHDAFPDKEHLVHRVLRLARRRPTRRRRSSRDTLKWHARNLVLGVTRNWAKTVVNWNLALDPTGGPHNGGCDTCTGVRHRRPGRHRHPQRRVLHARAPRAVRAARRGPDRQHVVRHHRLERRRSWTPPSATPTARPRSSCTTRTTTRATFAVAQGGASFDYTLPGGALATFTWPSSAGAGRRPPAARPARRDGLRVRGRRRRPRPSTTTRSPAGPPAPPSTPASPSGRPARDPHRRPGRSRHRGAHRGRRELGPGAAVRRLPARAAGLDQHRRHDLVGAGVGDRLRPDHHRRPDRRARPATSGSSRRAAAGPGGRSPTFASTPDRAEALVDGVTNGGFTTRNRRRPAAHVDDAPRRPRPTDAVEQRQRDARACGSARTCRW